MHSLRPLYETPLRQRLTSRVVPCALVFSLWVGGALADDNSPERARDLNYGTVLYEYYQGNAFEALSRLGVAELRGGIESHGDYPLLVEGGLLLSYGMTREAKTLFEQVLQDNVSPAKRNQAWFYLGKVFYLEQDHDRAVDALTRVDGVLLEEDDTELYYEWLYLKGQLALGHDATGLSGIITTLPEDSLWRSYLFYNQAIQNIADQQFDQAIADLGTLAVDLRTVIEAQTDDDSREEPNEALALREQALLSQAQLHLQQGQYSEAQASLQQISLDSVFSDQALFHYAVAAAQNQDYGIALQALNTLQSRPLFTPWLQQVPYARGYVYEQLGEDQRALQAYREAAGQYQTLALQLATERDQLTEAKIVAALRFDGAETQAGPDSLRHSSQVQPGSRVALGEAEIRNDPYGRLQVQPEDFSLAVLLSSETFQLGLRDLHELYRLQRSLSRWERQLSSFGVMLDTRAQQRALRIEQTRAALASQQADQWLAKQSQYNEQIRRAIDQEDLAHFMSDEQLAFDEAIQGALDTLATLPNDETTAVQRQKIQRIKAYFDWWVADQYAVNRWAAQKQLRGLNRAMAQFEQQHAAMQQEMAKVDHNADLARRVNQNQQRLETLRIGLDKALAATRSELLTQVRSELVRQEREVQGYLQAARHAQARLSDALFQAGRAIPDQAPDAGVQK